MRRSNQNDRPFWLPHCRLQERRKRYSLTRQCRSHFSDIVSFTGSFSSPGTHAPFSDFEPDDNRRPDILIRNPYGGGKQIIIDVALTGIDGTTRTNNDKADQPVIARRKQTENTKVPTNSYP